MSKINARNVNDKLQCQISMPDVHVKYISDNTNPIQHLITANEGSAIALAVGQYLSTGQPSLVYMQNSGLGNAINPIISLASKKVWSIPMVLIIGWRGSYGIKDEPQHEQQGQVTEKFLKTIYSINQSFPNVSALLFKTVDDEIFILISTYKPCVLGM